MSTYTNKDVAAALAIKPEVMAPIEAKLRAEDEQTGHSAPVSVTVMSDITLKQAIDSSIDALCKSHDEPWTTICPCPELAALYHRSHPEPPPLLPFEDSRYIQLRLDTRDRDIEPTAADLKALHELSEADFERNLAHLKEERGFTAYRLTKEDIYQYIGPPRKAMLVSDQAGGYIGAVTIGHKAEHIRKALWMLLPRAMNWIRDCFPTNRPPVRQLTSKEEIAEYGVLQFEMNMQWHDAPTIYLRFAHMKDCAKWMDKMYSRDYNVNHFLKAQERLAQVRLAARAKKSKWDQIIEDAEEEFGPLDD